MNHLEGPETAGANAIADISSRLVLARKTAGLSMRAVETAVRELPGHTKVSHATIRNYENGQTRPPIDVLAALSVVYSRPLQWFLLPGGVFSGVKYRNAKSKVTQKDRVWYEGQSMTWLEGYRRLEDYLDKPLASGADIDIDAIREAGSQGDPKQQVEREAQNLRKQLELGDTSPIISVVDILQRCGIRVIDLQSNIRIDGLAAKLNGEYVVVLNPTLASGRSRLTAAHELGHLIHGDCETDGKTEKTMDDLAFDLASHLLLPETVLQDAFKGKTFVRLVRFKETYGVSLAAMVYRAERSKIISSSEAKWLWVEFSKRGWRRAGAEPGNVRPDPATRFEEMLDASIESQELTWEKAVHVTGIRESDLRTRIGASIDDDDELRRGGATENSGLRLAK